MIKSDLLKWLQENKIEGKIEHPSVSKFGDYAVRTGKPLENLSENSIVEKIEFMAGFSNIWLKEKVLVDQAKNILSSKYNEELKEENIGKKMMVEFAHPNTHKELHIGHMRTLITGEALARLFETTGATAFRANYQGDIGPHVAKAIWGVQKMLKQENQTLTDWETKANSEKAHFLGKAYALGCADYDADNKDEIDKINHNLYAKDPDIMDIYKITRKWSLDYYNDFYARFYTTYDKLFFESEITEDGKKIVEANIGKLFEKGDEGAIIFDGEKYGLHKRVFITGAGTVTYEGKEMGLAYVQKAQFEYDKNIHVVGNEQSGYFKVVLKAMSLLDPWFEGRQYHLPMGMVTFADRKMSSRTGDIVTVDSILDETTKAILPLLKNEEMDKKYTAEVITIGAVKFSVLKSDPTQNTIFDVKKSVDLNGNSGPYLQYTYARCQSVIEKSQKLETRNEKLEMWNEEELGLLRYFYQFSEKIVEAAERYNPAILAEYLLNFSRKYNEFYGKCRIIGEPEEERRVFLTQVTAKILKDGLNILGIKTVEKM
ncbi:MAG TPA: arginine--tRNA ligase [Candidatus Methanoperedens sp.]|nr:arginine--tRNA ligase [Candidatus Methanoperedens sp.]